MHEELIDAFKVVGKALKLENLVPIAGLLGECLVAEKLKEYGEVFRETKNYDFRVEKNGEPVYVQVKTKCVGKSWQLNAGKFLDIEDNGIRKIQIIKGIRDEHMWKKNSFFIFVDLNIKDLDFKTLTSKFYIIPSKDLLEIIYKTYPSKRINGELVKERPKGRWDSKHCLISVEDIKEYEDKWKLIQKALTSETL